MIRRLTLLLLALMFFVVSTASAQTTFWVGSVYNDTLGAKVPNVTNFDWSSSGSGNAQGGQALALGTKFTFRYQSSLFALNAPDGQVVAFPGLNVSFEYTNVAEIPMEVAAYDAATKNYIFKTLPGGKFYIYHDAQRNANVASGFGFDDGNLAVSGTIDADQFISLVFVSSNLAVGSTILNGQVLSVDPAYLDPAPPIVTFRFESSVNFPPLDSTTASYFNGRTGEGNLATYTVTASDLAFKVDASTKFGITTAPPSISVTKTCTDAPAYGQPITFSATLKNTGLEPLNNITCTDTPTAVLTDVPSTLDPGQEVTVTGSYMPTSIPSTDVLTCSGTGTTSGISVSASSSATCTVNLTTDLTVVKLCVDAPQPGAAIVFKATLTNSGNEPLVNITCTDNPDVPLTGVPIAELAPGATATVSGSYVPTSSESTDTITCSGSGILSETVVTKSSSATCNIITHPCINVTKNCTDASAPGQPIIFTGTVTNCGDVQLDEVLVVDDHGGTVLSLPSLAPEASAPYSGSYVPTTSPSTNTVTATGIDAINPQNTVTSSASATCSVACTGSIGDFVWNDLNQNGIQDAGEPGISGAPVTITGTNIYGMPVNMTVNTDGSGLYQFNGLCQGTYTVTVPTPMGFTPSPTGNGTTATDSNGSPAPVTLPSDNASDQTIDFGFFKPCTGSIGDFVWNDLNQNGIQDAGEPGISGAPVTITGTNIYGMPVNMTVNTDGSGLYQFNGLCQGTYTVTVPTPMGFTPSPTGNGTTATDSNGSPAPVTLPTDNVSDQTIDFGFFKPIPSIDIRKQAEGPDSRNYPAGSTVPFEIAVTNTGNVPLTNVVVIDQLVANCAQTIGTLAAGQTVTYTCNASPVLASFTNTACAEGNYGTSSVNDCDTSTVTVNVPKIDITKYISIDGNTWLHTDSTNVLTVALCSTCEEDFDKDHCDYNHDNKCDEKDIDYCKSNKYDCDRHDSEHGSSKRHHRCDDSSNKPDCDGKAREAHERNHGDYNNDGKCDERDIDYCSYNKSTCDRHDTDYQSTKRAFRCDDSSSKTWCENKKKDAENSDRNRSDYNRDGKCDERDVDFCRNNKYACDQFDKDRGNLQRRFRCDDSANGEQCEGKVREEHEKDRSDYNKDGKCDERDIDFCRANRSDCDEHDKNHGNLKRSHKCDDSSDKATCEDRARQEHDKDRSDYNRDGKHDERDIDFCESNRERCVKHDRDHNICKRTYRCDDSSNKESCNSYAQREQEKEGSDYNHDGKCDERDINYCKGDQERCDKHDKDHGQSKRTYRCDDSSNKEYCYSYALREQEKDRSDYNRDGKCDEHDIDFCKGNQDECIKHDKDRGNFKRAYRCDDSSNRTLCESTRYAEDKRDKDLSDYNRDGKCNERDIDYCKYNSYACNKFDSDRGNKKRTFRCDDSYDKSSCESRAQWEHEKDHGDYNHDGKDDERDIEHCKNNSLSCDRHDRDHGDSKRNYRCDDSSDKTRCEEWAHGDNGGEAGCNGGDGYSADCGKVYFKYVVTNTGTSDLTNLTLTDNMEDLSSCVIPATLQPNGSFSCIIGPQTAQAGLHVNTATATGTYEGMLTQDTDQAYYFGCTQSAPLSPGYWKNHPESWPVESITIGGTVYTKAQAIELMGTPVCGDKTYTLFKALVAAKLDAMGCGDSSCVTETIANADAWMAAHPVGSGVPDDSSAWMQAEPWYLILDDYINGRLCGGSNSCTPPPPPAPTCGQCNGGTTKLTIMNKAWSSRSVVVKDCNGLTLFSGTVASNNSFTFTGKGTNGTMGQYVKIYVDGSYKATIYTDCSKPIYPGMGIDGYFMVVEGYSLNGGKFCRIQSSSCTDKDDYHYSKDYCDSHDGESTCSGSYNYQYVWGA